MSAEKKLQSMMSYLLLIGTLISIGFVFTGGLGYIVQHGHDTLSINLIQARTWPIRLDQITGSPLRLIEMGLLLLVMTQILRIALLVLFYMLLGDVSFTLISLFILAVLIYSLCFRY